MQYLSLEDVVDLFYQRLAVGMEIGSHGIVVVGWGDADYSKDQHSCEPHNACLYPAKGKAVERKERTDKVIVDGIDAFNNEGGKLAEAVGSPTERPLDIVEWDAAEEAGEDDEGKKGTIGDAHDVIVGVETLYDKYGSRCEILTGIPKEKRGVLHAGSDKISWMRRMLASDITVNIVYSEDKPQYCRGKGYILIDDTQDNIAQWEAAGGTGIVHVSAPETMAWLKSLGVL